MPTPTIQKDNSYWNLVEDIRGEFSSAKNDIVQFAQKRGATAYWNVGQFIQTHYLKNEIRAGYGEHLFEWLAEDTGWDKSELHRTVQLFKQGAIVGAHRQLGWNKIKMLLPVDNKTQRKQLAQQAVEEKLTDKELRAAVEEVQGAVLSKYSTGNLLFKRGMPFTYKVVAIPNWQTDDFLAIDCGFKCKRFVKITGVQKPKEGEIVCSIKNSDGTYNFTRSGTKNDLFVNRVYILDCVDADTLKVEIDLGFEMSATTKLRFRGINAFELSTKKGQEGKKFVEEKLKNVECVVIKSHGLDKYGRYLADVFYLAGEKDPVVVAMKGNFINQELLDAGFAVRMK